MEDIAKEFHYESLKAASGEYFETGDVIPRFTALKHHAICAVRIPNEEMFNIGSVFSELERQLEPDALNFRALALVCTEDSAEADRKRVLFAWTYDHLGSRLFSVHEMRKDGKGVDLSEVKMVGPEERLTIRVKHNLIEIRAKK
jgi:hypothetical protein